MVEIQYPLTYLKNIISPDTTIVNGGRKIAEGYTQEPGIDPITYLKTIVSPDTTIVNGRREFSEGYTQGPGRATTSLMFVYCDIIEPRIVGDVYAPLLRVLQLRQKGEYGSTEVKTFSPAHYFPLLLSSFRTIEISIRDDQGKAIPFDHGTLTVTLHLRRVQ